LFQRRWALDRDDRLRMPATLLCKAPPSVAGRGCCACNVRRCRDEHASADDVAGLIVEMTVRKEWTMIKNPIAWPNGARCACCLTFDMDADSLIHLVHPLDGYRRESDLSMLQYGPQVAIPRNRYIPQART
jgi:hypothetical protein